MALPVYTLSPEEMRAIFRYEKTFRAYRGGRVLFSGTCQVDLSDLECAICNMEKKNPSADAFVRDWYAPLARLGDFFGIGTACGFDEEIETVRVRGLPMEETEIFYSIWSSLEAFSRELLPILREELRLWKENQGKEPMDCTFSSRQIRRFLDAYQTWQCVTPEEQALYRRFCPEEPAPMPPPIHEPPASPGALLHFVRIFDMSNGRTYDYLTDDPTIRVNDQVVIWSFHKKTVVPVCGVFQKYESELKLDYNEYRKIIRKLQPGETEDDL